MKVDKRTKIMPLVATEVEKERIKDHLHKLNRARVRAGQTAYSFSKYGLEALFEKMKLDADLLKAKA